METQDIIGARIAVLGITGTSKNNTVGVLAVELLSQALPMTFIDPEGEMYGLKERFQLLVVGRSDQAELDVGPDHAAELAALSGKRGLSLILASQRSAKVDKDVLTQTSLLFLHQVLHPVDLDVYKALVPTPAKEVESQVRALQRGQTIVIGEPQRRSGQRHEQTCYTLHARMDARWNGP